VDLVGRHDRDPAVDHDARLHRLGRGRVGNREPERAVGRGVALADQRRGGRAADEHPHAGARQRLERQRIRAGGIGQVAGDEALELGDLEQAAADGHGFPLGGTSSYRT
jgi:hypothetical protein